MWEYFSGLLLESGLLCKPADFGTGLESVLSAVCCKVPNRNHSSTFPQGFDSSIKWWEAELLRKHPRNMVQSFFGAWFAEFPEKSGLRQFFLKVPA